MAPASGLLSLPGWLEPSLWGALAAWLVYLGLSRRRPGSADLATALCLASFPATAGVFAAGEALPVDEAAVAARLFLWLGFALGLSGVVMWLHHRADADGGGGEERGSDRDGPDPSRFGPEPPWWPEFEREFRRYAARPKPRQPVG